MKKKKKIKIGRINFLRIWMSINPKPPNKSRFSTLSILPEHAEDY